MSGFEGPSRLHRTVCPRTRCIVAPHSGFSNLGGSGEDPGPPLRVLPVASSVMTQRSPCWRSLVPDILVACTANIARSPLLAVLLQSHVDRRLGEGRTLVGSAGVAARIGDPAATGSRMVAEDWGLSLDDHRSQPLPYVPLDEVSLVVAMTRHHAREVASKHSHPERVFVLRELVALAALLLGDGTIDEIAAAASGPQDRLVRVVTEADQRRSRRRLRRRYDVPDPIGGDKEVYAALGEEFAEAGEVLADALFGPA